MAKSTKKSKVPEWFRNRKPWKLPKEIIEALDDFCGPDKYGLIRQLRRGGFKQKED